MFCHGSTCRYAIGPITGLEEIVATDVNAIYVELYELGPSSDSEESENALALSL